MPAEGDYTNQTLMEAYAGQENLNIDGDVVGNKDAGDIEDGVQSGIDMAEAFVNRLARVAGHTNIPLPESSADFLTLQALVTKLAIAETYFKRGDRDQTELNPIYGTYGRMNGIYKQARNDLEAFFAGVVDGSGGPELVEPGTFHSINLTFVDERTCGNG